MSLEQFHDLTGAVVDVTVVLAAIGAVVKFRLLNMLGHRWRSELTCAHWQLQDASYVLAADYALHNTGPRVLQVESVTLRLVPTRAEGPLLLPDDSKVLAQRHLSPSDPSLAGLFQIESGERTLFTLRCQLADLPEAVFVLCSFQLKHRRVPAAWRGFYCRGQPGTPRPSTPAVSQVGTLTVAQSSINTPTLP